MPAFRHGRQTAVLYGAYDLSQFLDTATPSRSTAMSDSTTFGATDKAFIVGLSDGKVALKGLLTGAVNEIDAVFDAAAGQDVGTPTLVGADGGLVVGRRCKIGAVKEASVEVNGVVADVVKVSGEFQVDGGLRGGQILTAAQAYTAAAATNGTGVDNGALTSNGGVAQIHCTANTWTGATAAKVQHSVDNATWADLATFTNLATLVTSSERIAVAAGTTVNRYLRAVVTPATGTGSITLSIAFARN